MGQEGGKPALVKLAERVVGGLGYSTARDNALEWAERASAPELAEGMRDAWLWVVRDEAPAVLRQHTLELQVEVLRVRVPQPLPALGWEVVRQAETLFNLSEPAGAARSRLAAFWTELARWVEGLPVPVMPWVRMDWIPWRRAGLAWYNHPEGARRGNLEHAEEALRRAREALEVGPIARLVFAEAGLAELTLELLAQYAIVLHELGFELEDPAPWLPRVARTAGELAHELERAPGWESAAEGWNTVGGLHHLLLLHLEHDPWLQHGLYAFEKAESAPGSAFVLTARYNRARLLQDAGADATEDLQALLRDYADRPEPQVQALLAQVRVHLRAAGSAAERAEDLLTALACALAIDDLPARCWSHWNNSLVAIEQVEDPPARRALGLRLWGLFPSLLRRPVALSPAGLVQSLEGMGRALGRAVQEPSDAQRGVALAEEALDGLLRLCQQPELHRSGTELLIRAAGLAAGCSQMGAAQRLVKGASSLQPAPEQADPGLAAMLGDVLGDMERFTDAEPWFEAALGRPQGLTDQERVMAQVGLAAVRLHQTRFEEAEELAQAALDGARAAGLSPSAALGTLARVWDHTGELVAARVAYQELLELLEQEENTATYRIITLNNLARLELVQERPGPALAWARRALAVQGLVPHGDLHAVSHRWAAHALWAQGLHDEAWDENERGLAIAKAAGAQAEELESLLLRVRWAHRGPRGVHTADALRLRELAGGEPEQRLRAEGELSAALLHRGQYAEALESAGLVLGWLAQLPEPPPPEPLPLWARRAGAQALGNAGIAWGRLGDPEKALEALNASLKLAYELEDLTLIGNQLHNRAELRAPSDLAGALADLHKSEEIATVANDVFNARRRKVSAHILALQHRGSAEDLERALKDAIALEQQGCWPEAAILWNGVGAGLASGPGRTEAMLVASRWLAVQDEPTLARSMDPTAHTLRRLVGPQQPVYLMGRELCRHFFGRALYACGQNSLPDEASVRAIVANVQALGDR